ncbi:MAG: efflux RND transporter periplasmic adaptor subunit [Isosphaeraceae bacterium]|nr:efflux RND transporter periplasmic adaptor subunit [Isosphaeraceae bacterium]
MEPTAVEFGVLEPADDDVVRCRVQSFLTLPSSGSRMVPSQGRTVRPPSSVASGGSTAARVYVPPRTSSRVRTSASTVLRGAGAAADLTRELPKIRSFDYVVPAHVVIRSSAGSVARFGPPPAPPSIASIVPEGTRVEKGDVVCELDSSGFRNELLVQLIRCERAKATVDQARNVLEVNQIVARTYREGIFPQDLELIRQFRKITETEAERARRAFDWSTVASQQGILSAAQADADRLALQEAELKLRLADRMMKRLLDYSSVRIDKALEAKLEATRADLLSLEFAQQIELDRKKRLESMIENCTLRAPRAGIVVYANKMNSWGRVEAKIERGVTVYESQPIFRMLDPKNLALKARINESQVARIHEGMPARVRLDAFPDQVLLGSVAEIVPIPAAINGPFSDVRIYLATVRFDAGPIPNLRTGLTGEVEFRLAPKLEVPRVPLEAVRWVGRQAFAAVLAEAGTRALCRWRAVSLGATDREYAEVVAGLEPGEQVHARPDRLPAPDPTDRASMVLRSEELAEYTAEE